jgi:hypothetical protein
MTSDILVAPGLEGLCAIPAAYAMSQHHAEMLPDPAVVIRVAIGFARRKGVALQSVPRPIRQQLEKLCAADDPAAGMVRDWLDGNRRSLQRLERA